MFMNTNDEQYQIQAVTRSYRILDLICKTNSEISLSDVCKELDVNSNMAYRLLMTMVGSGYLDKNEVTGKFRLTLKVLQLSRIAMNSLEIRRWAMPYLEELWQQFPKANVNLAVLERSEVLAVARIDSNKVPRTYFTVGRVLPSHATALGKVLLSEMDGQLLRTILGSGELKKYTDRTASTVEEFKDELAKVRREKIAWDRNEHIPGDNCVAAPVRGSQGTIDAAVSLSAFEIHMSLEDLESTVQALQETANKISQAMGFAM